MLQIETNAPGPTHPPRHLWFTWGHTEYGYTNRRRICSIAYGRCVWTARDRAAKAIASVLSNVLSVRTCFCMY